MNRGLHIGRAGGVTVSRILFWLAITMALLLIFLMLFNTFESITLRAIQKSYTEFAHHTATISDSMQSIVRALGTQIYYISSTTRLRTAQTLSTYDRIYAMREIGQYVSSSPMLQSIYVFNDATKSVYSTDELFFNTDYDHFGDREAVRLHLERGVDSRMRLSYRLIEAPGLLPAARLSYALMVFEVSPAGQPLAGSILLNLDPRWFREQLLDFPGDSYIVLDRDGHTIAQQAPWLSEAAAVFMPLIDASGIGDSLDGYVSATYEGEKYLCFYASRANSGWLHLRIMRQADQLPGLARIRLAVFLVFGGIAFLLLLALAFSFMRIYAPFSRMKTKLLQSALEEDAAAGSFAPVDRLDRLLAATQKQELQAALQDMLSGKTEADGRLPAPPVFLILLETRDPHCLRTNYADFGESLMAAPVQNMTAILGKAGPHMRILQLVQDIAQRCDCRCYFSAAVPDYAALPKHFSNLRELQQLRFLYPGQSVFSETLITQHRGPEIYPSEHSSELIIALKAGNERAVRSAFQSFIGALRKTPYSFLRYAVEHLLEQVELLLPEGGRLPIVLPKTDDMLSAAQDQEALYTQMLPVFTAASSAQAERRQIKVSATARQVEQRLALGYKDPNLSTQQIAEEMGISASYLRKQFYEAHQLSVNEYLNRVRIRKAQELLLNTDFTVESIALEIGFANTKYMFVLFKRIAGVTPRRYRMQNAKSGSE